MATTLRVKELLEERGWTAYELAKRSKGRLSRSAAYRLEHDDWKCLTREQMDALCIAFDFDTPALLFPQPTPTATKRRKR